MDTEQLPAGQYDVPPPPRVPTFTAPTNVRATPVPSPSIYDNMLTTHPSFVPVNSDVNSTAGRPGYEGAPAHYKGLNGIQTFDVWDAYNMDPYRANAWKYFARFNLKGSTKNDLDKLIHYIDEAINRINWSTQIMLNPEKIALNPQIVTESFGLQGLMADAAFDFLLSFVQKHPKTYLRAAKSQVQEYLASLGTV